MITVTIIAGNSDNRLTQKDWAQFVQRLLSTLQFHNAEFEFCGGPDTASPFQNFAFVVRINEHQSGPLRRDLENVRRAFAQNSVAWISGTTEFI